MASSPTSLSWTCTSKPSRKYNKKTLSLLKKQVLYDYNTLGHVVHADNPADTIKAIKDFLSKIENASI